MRSWEAESLHENSSFNEQRIAKHRSILSANNSETFLIYEHNHLERSWEIQYHRESSSVLTFEHSRIVSHAWHSLSSRITSAWTLKHWQNKSELDTDEKIRLINSLHIIEWCNSYEYRSQTFILSTVWFLHNSSWRCQCHHFCQKTQNFCHER